MAFKIHRGICSCGCGKEGIVCVRAGYIQQCNERIKKEKKNASPRMKHVQILDPKEKMRAFGELKQKYQLKRTPLKKKFPKKTGEGEIFNLIWKTRQHNCEVCGQSLKRVNASVGIFSHILSKGSYPDLRLDEENILLMGDGLYGNCFCHPIWEMRTAGMRNIEMWRPVFLLQDSLKRKSNIDNKPNYNFKENEEVETEQEDSQESIPKDETEREHYKEDESWKDGETLSD